MQQSLRGSRMCKENGRGADDLKAAFDARWPSDGERFRATEISVPNGRATMKPAETQLLKLNEP